MAINGRIWERAMCEHTHIVLVTTKPQGKKGKAVYMNPPQFHVECEDCGMILPIFRVTEEERIVPLIEI